MGGEAGQAGRTGRTAAGRAGDARRGGPSLANLRTLPLAPQVDAYHARRVEVWAGYDKAFAELPEGKSLGLPATPELDPDTLHARHLYSVMVGQEHSGITRDAFLTAMTRQGIGVGVHYLSLPEHPYYQQRLGWKPEDYPHAMRLGRQTVSLPISARLSDADVADVVAAVRRVLGAE